MRKIIAFTLTVLAAGILAATAFAGTKTVKMGDNWFVKSSGVSTVTINKGSKVKWLNVGDAPHDIKVTNGPVKFSSPTVLSGRSFTRTFNKGGTYRVFCDIHGSSDQRMTLKVQ